ncbi:MAG: lysine--tRNA ligase [Zetaproteobacteria bacterium CG06_land_8_20_14_3_00_59_53]|nr:MAG: lysine--tRNA ligase [Zetaproteobacteria bacterium CG2_30_59_37]PIO88908.1 MAG: lysine--tRNA ligase [Zetaproteobacteria bacterium CG23_combo_of_CG06-09_8_20_14_all_59_86]PIQ65265.1 MAG: lysine--tRNA ligase [Zetaproteobacteria bacterium CG11_big_fil_rev_8_21_14_0_20_59_439]PIU70845.1 MAG: lysine--tRNA ligase [Zetaproteobacteria bacterium CG06_land_8_20_14_3_00_59_53]PIU96461.1 MAG: lysine--tRNA ligase [Zetaproteobacteria bacterium CG03_land_8_20_14_0_80_59_51]PIY45388.1 MAG: lysine--tRNA
MTDQPQQREASKQREATPLPEQEAVRRDKLARIREQGEAFPNTWRVDATTDDILNRCGDLDDAGLEATAMTVRVAGRVMAHRVMGKSSFVQIQDGHGRVQLFLNREVLGEDIYAQSRKWDLGDIVGAEGLVFRTRTGELSVRAARVEMICKCLRPMPEKWHGLSDKETRYRQRYVDLMVTPETREVFRTRSKIMSLLRSRLEARDFMEVETPMLHTQPGGAAARPFSTHHNALDMELFLRIAPELFLKRLLVGGFERVFEINRNFRNEGVDATHNPEFTMVEFYQAYADVNDAMDTTESMIREIGESLGVREVEWDGVRIELDKPFRRIRMDEAVFEKRPDLRGHAQDKALLATVGLQEIEDFKPLITWKAGHYLAALFEELVEPELMEPTFVTHYPVDISPLARRNADEPFFTDRFELMIAGKEIANGFSELNDPEDQRGRLVAQAQAKAAGDAEATGVDEDFLRALEFGMPPAAGVGIGVDRLVMMFTSQHSIRDVLLFPHMRPEQL